MEMERIITVITTVIVIVIDYCDLLLLIEMKD